MPVYKIKISAVYDLEYSVTSDTEAAAKALVQTKTLTPVASTLVSLSANPAFVTTLTKKYSVAIPESINFVDYVVDANTPEAAITAATSASSVALTRHTEVNLSRVSPIVIETP